MKQLMKPILTLLIGAILFIIGYSLSQVSQDVFLSTWVICGIPYGLPRVRVWLSGRSFSGGMVMFILNFVIAGLFGGFIYIWRMFKSVFDIITICLNKNIDGQDISN